MPEDPQFWTNTLQEITAEILAYLPNLGVALVLLVVGWLIARVISAILGGILRRVGVDRLAQRAGAGDLLTSMGFGPSAVDLLQRLIYWLILLVFILAATEALGLPGVVDTLSGLIDYLPNVLAAALILLFGGVLARLVGDAAGGLAERSGIQAGMALGQLVRIMLLVFVVILTLGQLGVETTLLTTATMVLIGATGLALAVAFGLGSRELARNIMAGFHARDEFTVGQTLNVRGHQGDLARIGSVKAVLETETGRISLPNHALTEEEVLVLEAEADQDE